MKLWLKRIAMALTVAIFVLLALLAWPVVVVIATVAIGAFGVDRWRKWRSVQSFRATFGDQGKDLLLVFSNSPHWQRYIEETWLPRWGHRAVVLNWSERSQWNGSAQAAVALFRAYAGGREFNPLGIVVPRQGRQARVVRFWLAFRDYKHGKNRLLLEKEAELDGWLSAADATRG